MKKLVLFFSLMIILNFQLATAESDQILITFSHKMEKVQFDGKWSFFTEWKPSSLTSINNDQIKIRTAHYEDFIYIFIDVLSDITLDKNSDNVMICFDTKNNESIKPDYDDYCFVSTLDERTGIVLQGATNPESEIFEKILNPEGFLGISSISDQNDRYSKIPHGSYEFKIPTDVVGRSNEYGFYVQVFDASEQTSWTWPENIKNETKVPPSDLWGKIISIDNSLPEFHSSLLIFSVLVVPIILARSKKFNLKLLKLNIY